MNYRIRRQWHRRMAAAALVSLYALAGSPAGAAEDGGAKNVVVAVNQADGTKLARSGLQVTSVGGDTAAPENAAVARASCTDCRTVALAVQAVFITGDASTITPRNAAAATNSGCLRCHTMASAYQCAVTTSGSLTVGAEGQRRLAELRGQISALAASDLTFDELEAEMDVLVSEVWGVVNQALAAAGETNRCSSPLEQTTTT